VVHVLQTFHVVVLQRTAKKCTKNYNARAQPLFRSLNLLFSDVTVAVVVFLSSLMYLTSSLAQGLSSYVVAPEIQQNNPCSLELCSFVAPRRYLV